MALAWFPCYVNDLLGSLAWRCMTPAQRGAYWQLICCQMQAETGTLPEDTAMLSRLAELDLGGENGIVLDKFPLHAGGGRANPRAYAEWLKRVAISGERSKAGAIGGATPKQLLSKPEAIAKQMLKQNGSKPEAIAHTPTTTSTTTLTTDNQNHNNTPRKRGPRAQAPAGLDADRFARFWAAYPKHKAKATAERAWAKIAPDDALLDMILSAIEWQRKTPDWLKDKGEYIPHPSTYLNNRRWEDERPGNHNGTRPVEQEDDVAIALRMLKEGAEAARRDEAAALAAKQAGAQ